jgi:hypothetical protein
MRMAVGLRSNDETYVAHVARRKLTIEAGEPAEVDATIAGDARAIAAVTYGGRPLADAVSTGDLVVTGSMAAAESFLNLYTLPPAVSA